MDLCLRRQTIAMTNLPILLKLGMEFETDASVALTFFDDALVEADEEVLDRLGDLPQFDGGYSSGKNQKSPLSWG